MMMIWPLCRLYSIANNVLEFNEDGPIGGAGAGTGAGTRAGKGVGVEAGNCGRCGVKVDGAEGSSKVDEERVEVFGAAEVGGTSDLLPLAFLGPLNVTIGSSRFQQFFIYAKLMTGLRLSNDLESNVTPLALHKVVIKVGNPSREESCWAMIETWWEMR